MIAMTATTAIAAPGIVTAADATATVVDAIVVSAAIVPRTSSPARR